MFTTRLISGIILVILAAFLLVKGGTLLFLVSLAISLIGLFELYRVMKIEKELPGLVGYGAVLAYYAIVWTGMDRHVTFLSIAALMLLMTIYVFTFPKFTTEQITVAFFGIFYVGLMLSYLYQVRSMPDGKYLVWLIVLSSWGCDTCAYCVGKLIGKHKMTPKLSPKKSVEGGIGGVAGAAILGAVYGLAIAGKMGDGSHIASFAVICAAGGLISMVGDLAASAIKRNHDIKDYGHLIPGHGGILDRFDSVILIAPVIYYLALALL